MKKIIIAFIFIFITINLYADEITMPWSCYPKEVQKVFAREGVKLDLSGNDRTPESWGFLVNKGTEFTIYTYQPMRREDWNLFNKIFYGTENKNGEVDSSERNQ